MKNYDFCNNFIKQFDSEFLKSIQNYTLPDIVKINIILSLSSITTFKSFYWNDLKIISSLILDNNFCLEKFDNIDNNITLHTILKYNLAKNIIKFENFLSFLHNLEEDIIFVLLKQSNDNFFDLENDEIKYKFLISHNTIFQLKDKPELYSPILQHYFIKQLLDENNRILKVIINSEDKIFISHTFLNTIIFINNLNFYINSEDSFNQFYKLTYLFKKSKNLDLILNNIEYIKSMLHNLVYLLYQNNLIDNDLKSNIETIIFEKQLQFF